MEYIDICLAFILGVLLTMTVDGFLYWRGYLKMRRQINDYIFHLNELKEQVDKLSYLQHDDESHQWTEKAPCINTPDGVIKYLRSKYMPGAVIRGSEVDNLYE